MFKIGDFSRLSRVSVRTLRLYDEMGLLKPAQVDALTGYRYYDADQLAQLNRIITLKDLGFSLEQVSELLDEHVPSDQIRGMLRLKQAELQQLVAVEQARLARVEARLHQIEQDDAMQNYDVILKPVEVQSVAAIRDVISTCHQFKSLHYELWDELKRQNVEMVGFPQTLWHDAEYKVQDVDAEAIALISQPLPTPSGRVKTYTLSGAEQMACVVHSGGYDTIERAFSALLKWIGHNHYQVRGVNRDVYLNPLFLEKHCPMSNCNLLEDGQTAIEIQFPVEPCR